MVASNHELQFRGRLLEEVENSFIFREIPHFCDIAAVNENIAFGEGLTVGVLGIVAGERDDSVCVGDNAKAGFHCARRHNFAGIDHTTAKAERRDLGVAYSLLAAIASRRCLGRSILSVGV